MADRPRDEFEELASQLRDMCSTAIHYGPQEHSVWNFVPYTGLDIDTLKTVRETSWDSLSSGDSPLEHSDIVMWAPLHLFRRTSAPIQVTQRNVNRLRACGFPHRLVVFRKEEFLSRLRSVPDFPFPSAPMQKPKVEIRGRYDSLKGWAKEGLLLTLPRAAHAHILVNKLHRDIRFSDLDIRYPK